MGPGASGEAVEFHKCAANPAYFIDTYGVIDDAQGEGGASGTMPFRLWPAQVPVMFSLFRDRLLVILKARQLGITWVVVGYILWLVLFHNGKVALLFSKGQKEANEMLRRVKSLYLRLPERMREKLPRPNSLENRSELEFSNGSRVESLPATAGSGRSFTASVVVIDEAAWMRYAGQLLEAAKPTIDAGGQMVILSTANGVGRMFHAVWTRAVRGLNGFKTVFLPWWARPGRDHAWYERVLRESNEPKTIPQEYPANATEAFLASGRTRFEFEWVNRQGPNVRPPVPKSEYPLWARMAPDPPWLPASRSLPALANIRDLEIYEFPRVGRRYGIGADVAEGKEPEPGTDPDYNAAVVVDLDTWEEVARVLGRQEPDEYASILESVAEAYSAKVVVERNNHGHAVLTTMKLDRCPHVASGHDDAPGWLTTSKTKDEGIDLLAEVLRDGLITVRTQATLDEMLIYRRLKNGSTGAPLGYHDDLVMAWYCVLSWLREARKNPGQGPARVIGDGYRTKNYLGR